jgi:hypothetical protein
MLKGRLKLLISFLTFDFSLLRLPFLEFDPTQKGFSSIFVPAFEGDVSSTA